MQNKSSLNVWWCHKKNHWPQKLRLVVSEQFSVKWIHLLDILMKSSYFTSVLTGNVVFFILFMTVTQFAVGVSAGCLTSLSKSNCTQSPLCHWFGW